MREMGVPSIPRPGGDFSLIYIFGHIVGKNKILCRVFVQSGTKCSTSDKLVKKFDVSNIGPLTTTLFE